MFSWGNLSPYRQLAYQADGSVPWGEVALLECLCTHLQQGLWQWGNPFLETEMYLSTSQAVDVHLLLLPHISESGRQSSQEEVVQEND